MSYTLVRQCTRHHCFPACLESFLKDNKINITQDEIVNLSPDAHYKGMKIEGALHLNKLGDIEDKFPVTITPLPNITTVQPPKQTILFFTYWKGDKTQFHCVRFIEIKENKIILMNPNHPKLVEEIEINIFSSWPKLPILFETK